MLNFTCQRGVTAALRDSDHSFPRVKNFIRASAGKALIGLFGFLAISSSGNAQGTWTPLTNAAPHYNEGEMMLMTDGTVLAKTSSGGNDGYGNTWDKLTPDSHGSYVNGTWTTIAAMTNTRLYFSSQVLPDGRLYIAGGEYGPGGSNSEVYNPLTNTWTTPLAPSGVNVISDANSEILPNGQVLQAMVDAFGTTHNFLWNPATNTYAAGATCLRLDNEAVWVKLPDNSILFADNYGQTTERYIPATNTWINDATMPVDLYDAFGSEAGAAFLLPDGRVFFIGSTPVTAYYTPSGTTAPGTWVAGPAIPGNQGAPDAASAMMVNGKILLAVSPTPTSANHFPSPTQFYEFDYTTNTFTLISAPGGGTSANMGAYITNMVDLPDGTVLYANDGTDQYYTYSSTGSALAAGKPTIAAINPVNCDTFQVTGTLFNGITEGAAYGDDWQMSTNFPIIRITSGTNVYYARSFNWNRIGAVMTGSLPDTTLFALPAGLAYGTYSMQVIANGNASDPATLTVGPPALTLSATHVCPGASVTVSSSQAGTWSSSSSNATVGTNTGVITGVTSGSATIIFTPAAGCIGATTVNVDALPVAASAITAPSAICPGSTVTYTTGAITNATSYTWTVTGAGWSGTSTTGSIAVTAGSGTATITATGVNACGSGTASILTTAPNNNVPAAPTSIVAPALICNTSSGVFSTPTVANATGYVWTVTGTGWSGTSTGNSITITAGSGPGTISVAASDACGDGTAYTLTDVVPSYYPANAPVVTPSVAACVGSSLTYSVTPLPDVTSYIWTTTGTGWQATASTGTTDDITSGSVTGTVTCRGENACGDGPETVVVMAPGTAPIATGILTPQLICANDTATLTAIVPPGTTGYQWSVSGTGWSGTSTTGNIMITAGTGVGTVSVNAIGACGTGPAFTINDIIAMPAPVATFIVDNNNITTGTAEIITYTGNAPVGATYNWYFDGGVATPGTGAGPQSVVWSSDGVKNVTLAVNNGSCTGTFADSVMVSFPTGVQSVSLQNNLSISPNPNDGTFDILFYQSITQPFTVKLFDMQGRVVYERDFKSTTNNKVTIATQNLPDAVYTATIDLNGTVINRKVVINK